MRRGVPLETLHSAECRGFPWRSVLPVFETTLSHCSSDTSVPYPTHEGQMLTLPLESGLCHTAMRPDLLDAAAGPLACTVLDCSRRCSASAPPLVACSCRTYASKPIPYRLLLRHRKSQWQLPPRRRGPSWIWLEEF